MKSRTVAVSIAAPPEAVYAFAADPANLPRWAPGLCTSVTRAGEEWRVATPEGEATLRFAEANAFGVLDHAVRLASGVEAYNPMRVLPNGAGSEVVFTLFQRPGVSDAAFAADARLVEQDLRTLKQVLEDMHGA